MNYWGAMLNKHNLIFPLVSLLANIDNKKSIVFMRYNMLYLQRPFPKHNINQLLRFYKYVDYSLTFDWWGNFGCMIFMIIYDLLQRLWLDDLLNLLVLLEVRGFEAVVGASHHRTLDLACIQEAVNKVLRSWVNFFSWKRSWLKMNGLVSSSQRFIYIYIIRILDVCARYIKLSNC